MQKLGLVSLVALSILVASTGFSGAPPARAQTCAPPAAASGETLALQLRGDNALVIDATVSLSEAAPLFIEYGSDGLGWLRTPTQEPAATHRLALLRLRPETTYLVRAFSLAASGCPAQVAFGEVTTGAVPDALKNFTVTTRGAASFSLLAMDWPTPAPFLPPNAPGDRSRYFAGLDQDGALVWYYTFPRELPIPPPEASAYPLVRRANGNLLYIAGYYGIDEITPDGRLVRRIRSEDPAAARVHHELVELPGERLLFLGADDRSIDDSINGGPKDLLLRGDTLHEVNLQTDNVARVLDPVRGVGKTLWNAFESLDPTARVPEWAGWKIRGVPDWTHANAMSVGPRGNIVISFRHLDQIISLSPDAQTIQWRLGGPGSTLRFADPDDVFRGQHSVLQLPNGHLLMFDNGNYKPAGEFSRALELELDLERGVVRKVWEYRPEPEIFSDKISNVVRLPNGNTLVHFGWRVAPDEPSLVQEVTPEGAVVWQQTIRWRGLPAARYRVYPWTTLAGEQPVEPTPIQGR